MQLSATGKSIGCTFEGVAGALTQLLKQKRPPFFKGREPGFADRKRLVESASTVAEETIRFLPFSENHFRRARQLFFALCAKDDPRNTYAQFADYLDGALILMPPPRLTITHVWVGHSHVKYILEKCRWSGSIIR